MNPDTVFESQPTGVSASDYPSPHSNEEGKNVLTVLMKEELENISQLNFVPLSEQLEKLRGELHALRTDKAKLDHDFQLISAKELHYKTLSQQLLVEKDEMKVEILTLRDCLATVENQLRREQGVKAQLASENARLLASGHATTTESKWRRRLHYGLEYSLYIGLALYAFGLINVRVVDTN